MTSKPNRRANQSVPGRYRGIFQHWVVSGMACRAEFPGNPHRGVPGRPRWFPGFRTRDVYATYLEEQR